MSRRTLALLSIPAALCLVALAVIYVSEWRMHRRHDVPLPPLTPEFPADPGADVIEGIHRITAPTLSEVVPLYSYEELARLVRFGVKRDGRSAVGMRAGVLWPMGDQDLVNIFAHLRHPVPAKAESRPTIGPAFCFCWLGD